jgi:acetyl-CoA synthetase
MPQRFETAVAHIALYQLAAVAMPLSMLFGPDALEYRINHSEAKLAIVDESTVANVLAARPACPELRTVIGVGGGRRAGRSRLERGARRPARRASTRCRRMPMPPRC